MASSVPGLHESDQRDAVDSHGEVEALVVSRADEPMTSEDWRQVIVMIATYAFLNGRGKTGATKDEIHAMLEEMERVMLAYLKTAFGE